jgi:hypothetical protein
MSRIKSRNVLASLIAIAVTTSSLSSAHASATIRISDSDVQGVNLSSFIENISKQKTIDKVSSSSIRDESSKGDPQSTEAVASKSSSKALISNCFSGNVIVSVCDDDSNADSGLSLDAEIMFSDFWIDTNNPERFIVDVVPYRSVSDYWWHATSGNYLIAWFDQNGDGQPDVGISPRADYVSTSTPGGLIVLDRGASGWTARASSCAGSTNLIYGTHPYFIGYVDYWSLSADWSCVFGSAPASVSYQVYMEDYWNSPYGDFSPDNYFSYAQNIYEAFKPSQPQNLSFSTDVSSLTASWSGSSAKWGRTIATHTLVVFNSAGAQVTSCSSTSTSCSVSGLAPGQGYSAYVYGTDSRGLTSPGSSSFYGTTLLPNQSAPALPVDVKRKKTLKISSNTAQGAPISLSVSGACSKSKVFKKIKKKKTLVGYKIKAKGKKGACNVSISAPAIPGYSALNSSSSITVR